MRTASVGPLRENRVGWEVRWEQLAWKWTWGKRHVRKLFRNALCVWCHAVVPQPPYYLTLSSITALLVSSENFSQDLDLSFFWIGHKSQKAITPAWVTVIDIESQCLYCHGRMEIGKLLKEFWIFKIYSLIRVSTSLSSPLPYP